MSKGPDFELSDLTSAVEANSSVSIGDYSGAYVYCGPSLCMIGWG